MDKFCVPDEIRKIAADAAKCRNPVTEKHLRKIARNARREIEARRAVLPREKVINRLVVTKLWVNGRANDDRDEWTEEVRAHCERCYDDKAETLEVQAERLRGQRTGGDRRVALQGRVGLQSLWLRSCGREGSCGETRPTGLPTVW